MTPGRRAAALGAVFLAALAVRLLWVRAADPGPLKRSEERRVGKECRL